MLLEPPGIIQSQYFSLASDVTTVSTSFVDMTGVTITVNTDDNPLLVWFSVSGDASVAAELKFQLVIDGSAKRGTHMRVVASGSGHCAQLIYKTAAQTRGSHVVKIQWLTSTGTGRVRPVTTPIDHAALLVEEVTI